nr:uncharacterized protein LOC130540691 isoform X1 [Pan paniscus]
MVLPAKSLKEPRELCENKADTGESSTGDGDRIPMIHLNTRTQERLWNGMTLQSCRLKVYFHLTLPHFTDKKNETQKQEATHPTAHSEGVVKAEFTDLNGGNTFMAPL